MKVASLFSGVGGLDLGFKNAGHEIVWANDNYKDAVDTYKLNIGNHIVLDDIKNIKSQNIPNHDILIGGFPCQGFSIANTKRNSGDERNQLYLEFLRVIKDKQPKFFVAENVKGILSLEKGKVFEMILTDFAGAGYKVKSKVLNAANYGVPQRRERVIVIGVREDLDCKIEHPFPTHSNKIFEKELQSWITVHEALKNVPDPDKSNSLKNHTYSKFKLKFNGYMGNRAMDPNKPAPTVTGRGDSKGGVVVLHHPNNERRMSVRELAIIQSFPIDFEFAGPNSSAYRQIGNAVPPQMALEIAKIFPINIESIVYENTKEAIPNYKWRWAVYTPTESLNNPPIFLGILRVLRNNEHRRFSSEEVNLGLQTVQHETESTVNLVRSTDRNIFRNSGQYWRGLGMLSDDVRGQITLSNFGRMLADGELTQVQFATTIIKSLELPNRRIESDTSDWDSINLSFKPFEIILSIITELNRRYGLSESYITPQELIRIVIPLAGDTGTINEYVESIHLVRQGRLDITNWPDCAPALNDKRMAREFMLFLSNYGFCNAVSADTNMQERYFLSAISLEEITELYEIDTTETELDRIERIIRRSQIPANIERKRVMREVLDRPNQRAFRKMVLEAYNSTCLITGIKMDTVLEAAHIIPVKDNGSDLLLNGICMRADIHTLYDSNNLRIQPNGTVLLSVTARQRENYDFLPNQIVLPNFINPELLDWRMKYY